MHSARSATEAGKWVKEEVSSADRKPHVLDLELKLRPGMVTLTWTSMNIDAYKHHIHVGLQKLEELINRDKYRDQAKFSSGKYSVFEGEI